MTQENNKAELSRLRWACRRGMLELDLLLIPFFDKHYAQLTPKEQASFAELLSCTDPELFSWLMGHARPEKPEFCKLVERIREHDNF
jgi:antitoxin CptB